MHRYIIKRLLYLIPILIGVTFIVFAIMHFSPGDPATLLLGEDTTQEEIERVREIMGLNDPFIVQYGNFLGGLARGNLGRSLQSGRPVVEEIGARLPATMQLAGGAILVAVVIGLVMGILAATKQYSIFDGGSMGFALLGASMPNFWLGLMMILLFSVYWNNNFGYPLFPSSGYGTLRHLVMPAIVLGTAHAAYITRITRSSMLEVLRQDYIRTSRAKGMSERKVVYYHALWNALIPVITITGLQFGVLLGGSVVTETIFAWPGIGRMLIQGIRTQNYPIVQGTILVFALMFSLITLLVDILYGFIDPRIKAKYKS